MNDLTNKSFFNKDTNRLFFLAGDSCECENFSQLFEHRKEVYFDINVHGIMVDKDKNVYSVGYHKKDDRWYFWQLNINGVLYADGTGADYALAALDLGQNAKQAVQVAIKRDFYSGGLIKVYDIQKAKFI